MLVVVVEVVFLIVPVVLVVAVVVVLLLHVVVVVLLLLVLRNMVRPWPGIPTYYRLLLLCSLSFVFFLLFFLPLSSLFFELKASSH